MKRGVGNGVREVDEEGLVFVLLDELNGALGEALGEEVGIGFHFDDFFILEKREEGELVVVLTRVKGVDVVAVGDAEKFIEALSGGEEFRLVAEVPFAEHSGFVSDGFEDFGDGDFVGVESLAVSGEEDSMFGAFSHVDSGGIATGH